MDDAAQFEGVRAACGTIGMDEGMQMQVGYWAEAVLNLVCTARCQLLGCDAMCQGGGGAVLVIHCLGCEGRPYLSRPNLSIQGWGADRRWAIGGPTDARVETGFARYLTVDAARVVDGTLSHLSVGYKCDKDNGRPCR